MESEQRVFIHHLCIEPRIALVTLTPGFHGQISCKLQCQIREPSGYYARSSGLGMNYTGTTDTTTTLERNATVLYMTVLC